MTEILLVEWHRRPEQIFTMNHLNSLWIFRPISMQRRLPPKPSFKLCHGEVEPPTHFLETWSFDFNFKIEKSSPQCLFWLSNQPFQRQLDEIVYFSDRRWLEELEKKRNRKKVSLLILLMYFCLLRCSSTRTLDCVNFLLQIQSEWAVFEWNILKT